MGETNRGTRMKKTGTQGKKGATTKKAPAKKVPAKNVPAKKAPVKKIPAKNVPSKVPKEGDHKKRCHNKGNQSCCCCESRGLPKGKAKNPHVSTLLQTKNPQAETQTKISTHCTR